MWFQSIMSGVGAQDDPCTATIFWSIVRHHLIYSASSPVPLTECSVLHNGINIVAWFHKNVYLSDECWIHLKPLPCFSFRFFVVHISPITIRELNSDHQQSPMRVGCCPYCPYCGVLPGALKGSFVTLISPPQCYAAFGTMPHILASVDQSPVCRPRALSHLDEDA
jgi:hypothetical protein